MTTTDNRDLTWEPPGPGQWTASIDHWHRPLTPIMRGLVDETFAEGFRRAFEQLGAALETLALEFVNGVPYIRPVPLIDKPNAKPPPPAVLRLVCRIHPKLRKRLKTATHLLATEGWRPVMERWYREQRPAYEARNRQLQEVDLEALEDDQLTAHLDEAIEHLRQGLFTHFEISPIEAAPFGLLCVEAEQWGLEPEELLDVLVGCSGATSAPSRELQPLRAELAEHGCRPTSLAEVEACSARAAELLAGWMADRRWIASSGYDLDDLTLGEMPQAVLGAIQSPPPPEPDPDPSAPFRSRVPKAECQRFDKLVGAAREAFALRDDNGPITVEWPVGLVRRALLEVGRRGVDRGTLPRAGMATMARRDEVGAILTRRDTTVAPAIEARSATRRAITLDDIPTVLGEAGPPPDPSALPGALGLFIRAATVILDLELAAERRLAHRAATAPDGTVLGVGIGTQAVRGRARLSLTPEDLGDFEPGDILITPATCPTWNVILTAAGGLVVEEGGLTGHAAIVARELSLPTVIGAKRATALVPDGAEVEVDPIAGTVRVL